jgi:predicted transcriptional regulator
MTNDSKNTKGDPGNVINLLRKAKKGQADEKAFAKRWGRGVAQHGYTMVPTVLLWMQGRLGLNPSQFLVLLQVLSHWFKDDSLPWPAKETIATRLGIKPRQIQRILTDLETAGLIKRVPRHFGHGGQTSNAYDPSGLVKRIKELEPEYRKMKEENKARRAEVETPVGRRRKAGSPSASK